MRAMRDANAGGCRQHVERVAFLVRPANYPQTMGNRRLLAGFWRTGWWTKWVSR